MMPAQLGIGYCKNHKHNDGAIENKDEMKIKYVTKKMHAESRLAVVSANITPPHHPTYTKT